MLERRAPDSEFAIRRSDTTNDAMFQVVAGSFRLPSCVVSHRLRKSSALLTRTRWTSLEKTIVNRFFFVHQLRHTPVIQIKKGLNSQSLGAPAENRTPDTLIKSQVLYQLSYRGIY